MRGVKFFGLLLVIPSLLINTPAAAQEPQSIGLSATPAIIELASEPGKTYEKQLRLFNSSQLALPVSVAVQSFLTTEVLVPDERYDASQWIETPFTTELFKSQESKLIPLRITIPDDASPGGHYAQISIRGLSLEGVQGTGAKSIVVPELVVGVYITVAGAIEESYQLHAVSAVPMYGQPYSNITSQFTVLNDGNVHNIVTAKLVLKKNSAEVDEIAFPVMTALPGMQKTNMMIWRLPDSFGMYSAKIELSYGTPTNITQSKEYRLVITPPIGQLAGLWLVVWLVLFSIHNGRRLKSTVRILIKGS